MPLYGDSNMDCTGTSTRGPTTFTYNEASNNHTPNGDDMNEAMKAEKMCEEPSLPERVVKSLLGLHAAVSSLGDFADNISLPKPTTNESDQESAILCGEEDSVKFEGIWKDICPILCRFSSELGIIHCELQSLFNPNRPVVETEEETINEDEDYWYKVVLAYRSRLDSKIDALERMVDEIVGLNNKNPDEASPSPSCFAEVWTNLPNWLNRFSSRLQIIEGQLANIITNGCDTTAKEKCARAE